MFLVFLCASQFTYVSYTCTRCLGQVPQTRARPRERTQDEGAAKQRHSSGAETTHRATGVAIHRQAACCCLRVGGNASNLKNLLKTGR